MAAGLRVRAVHTATVERFRALPVANVSDRMGRLSAAGARLRPMHKGGGLAGPALTPRAPPGDNLMLHKAIQLAGPGDVVVMDAGGDLTNALMGEMMLMQFARKGVAGIVINGAVRDAAFIRAQEVPVYAAGITHHGPYKNGPGEINVSVAIDGMVVEPGDLVIGDEDGLLCVPFADTEAVLAAGQAKFAAEQKQIAAIQAGTHNPTWVDEQLRNGGCEFVS